MKGLMYLKKNLANKGADVAIDFKIDPSHPVFTATPFVHSNSCILFEKLKLNYFQYARCYRDGSFTLLVNSTKILEELIALQSPTLSYIDVHLLEKQSYNFLWEETLPKEPVRVVGEKHNFHNGLTIMKRYKDYYDMIGFAMPAELHNKNTQYLNYYTLLDDFAESFIVEHSQLFKYLDKNKIHPPEPLRDPNRQLLCLQKELKKKESSIFSKQEHMCMELLKKGYTYKQIAFKLGISSRTVETYIYRIKQKTGAPSKAFLLNL